MRIIKYILILLILQNSLSINVERIIVGNGNSRALSVTNDDGSPLYGVVIGQIKENNEKLLDLKEMKVLNNIFKNDT